MTEYKVGLGQIILYIEFVSNSLFLVNHKNLTFKYVACCHKGSFDSPQSPNNLIPPQIT